MKNKVFLGGTVYGNWRSFIIDRLPSNMDYFNPIVDNWTPECKVIEEQEKEFNCNIHLYVITSEMTGVYSIAEIMDSVHTGKTTLVQIIPEGFTKSQLSSFESLCTLIIKRGGQAVIEPSLFTMTEMLDKIK